jgi:hypothetical protein
LGRRAGPAREREAGRRAAADSADPSAYHWEERLVNVVAFLEARLAEEEIRASTAATLRARLDDPSRQLDRPARMGAELVWRGAGLDAEKMVRDLEAKRRIIFLAAQMPELMPKTGIFDGQRGAWADVLRVMAAVYAEHPDYDLAWTT